MIEAWTNFLRSAGAANDFAAFGEPAAELAAAQSASIIAPLADLGIIRVSGEDAVPFLHNLLTRDLKSLPVDAAGLAGLCNVKGRLTASFLVWREGGDILLALSAELAPAVLGRLSKYILRSRVELADASGDKVLLGLSGSAAMEALGQRVAVPEKPMTVSRAENVSVIRLDGQRAVVATSPAAAPELWRLLSAHARPAGLAAWHWLEIAAGAPRITAATEEQFLPQMVNFELIGGVSFNKGCYPGQEIVARTQYLGKVKRRMYRVRVADAAPAPGIEVFAPQTGAQACGAIVLAAPSPAGGHEALAVVQSTCYEAGDVHLGAPDGPRLEFLSLPYPLA